MKFDSELIEKDNNNKKETSLINEYVHPMTPRKRNRTCTPTKSKTWGNKVDESNKTPHKETHKKTKKSGKLELLHFLIYLDKMPPREQIDFGKYPPREDKLDINEISSTIHSYPN